AGCGGWRAADPRRRCGRWLGGARPPRSAGGDMPVTKDGLGRQSDLAIGGIDGRPTRDGAPKVGADGVLRRVGV
ncbi:hypothetical protein, partial [Frankia casuarinae]|uniref:hypothetical protein n=1 Tax=Frankia casuarinae (strain DSM 45818 / CECT 9043 / HFP020203 / CcI3) TaxID=106370 RepID=UPI001F27027A